MERLAARSHGRYDELLRSYEAARTFYRTAEYKPGIPTPADQDSVRRQIDEAAIAREMKLRAHRLEAMKMGYQK